MGSIRYAGVALIILGALMSVAMVFVADTITKPYLKATTVNKVIITGVVMMGIGFAILALTDKNINSYGNEGFYTIAC